MTRRTAIVEIKIKVVMEIDNDITIDKVVNEMDYDLEDMTGKAAVTDTTMTDFNILTR